MNVSEPKVIPSLLWVWFVAESEWASYVRVLFTLPACVAEENWTAIITGKGKFASI